MHYVIDSKNATKFLGLMIALGSTPELNITVSKIIADGIPDVRPNSKPAAIAAAKIGVVSTLKTYERRENHNKPVTAICLQKGASLETNELVGIVVAQKSGSDKFILSECEPIPFSSEVTRLVKEEGMDIYDAYGAVYGDKVKNKEVPLLEALRPDLKEKDWFAEGILKVLSKL